MNLMELKKDLSEKKLQKLYIFTGEEIAILRIYLGKLSKLFPGQTFEVDALSGITSRLKSNSLINTKKSMYIIRDDRTVLTAEKIWKSLKSGTYLNKSYFSLISNTILHNYITLNNKIHVDFTQLSVYSW